MTRLLGKNDDLGEKEIFETQDLGFCPRALSFDKHGVGRFSGCLEIPLTLSPSLGERVG
jgi:hypothetical protein